MCFIFQSSKLDIICRIISGIYRACALRVSIDWFIPRSSQCACVMKTKMHALRMSYHCPNFCGRFPSSKNQISIVPCFVVMYLCTKFCDYFSIKRWLKSILSRISENSLCKFPLLSAGTIVVFGGKFLWITLKNLGIVCCAQSLFLRGL